MVLFFVGAILAFVVALFIFLALLRLFFGALELLSEAWPVLVSVIFGFVAWFVLNTVLPA